MGLQSLFSLHDAKLPLIGQKRQEGIYRSWPNPSLGKAGPEKGNILLKVTSQKEGESITESTIYSSFALFTLAFLMFSLHCVALYHADSALKF